MNDHQPSKPNLRNLIGIFGFLIALGLYAFVVAAGGDWLQAKATPLFLQILYYFIFGIVWFWPAKSIFRWMAAGQNQKD